MTDAPFIKLSQNNSGVAIETNITDPLVVLGVLELAKIMFVQAQTQRARDEASLTRRVTEDIAKRLR